MLGRGELLMSLVFRKVSYSISLKFPLFGVDVSKDLSESELKQFHAELKRLETAVACQLGTFASLMTVPTHQAHASKENMAKILRYAEGNRLFTAIDVEEALGLSRNMVYPALNKLVAEKKLLKLRVPSRRSFGYSLVKKGESVSSVEIEADGARFLREDLKRLNSAEMRARLDSR